MFRVVGAGLVISASVGFLIVADDLRHTGELVGVGTLLIAGLALLAGSYSNAFSRRLAVPWIAPSVLLSALWGAHIDDMLTGLALGLIVGSCLAFVLRKTSMFR